MAYFQPDKAPLAIERRAARRTRAACAASLRTLTRESFGYLWDLSETGARVSVDNPPQAGNTAILKWGTEKVTCRIIWIDRDLCGLSFERPIDPAIVASSSRMIGIVEQPTAAIDNIPAGHKRTPLSRSTHDTGGT